MNPFDAKVIRDGLDRFLEEANTFCQIVDDYDPVTQETERVGNELAGILIDIYVLRENLDNLIPDYLKYPQAPWFGGICDEDGEVYGG